MSQPHLAIQTQGHTTNEGQNWGPNLGLSSPVVRHVHLPLAVAEGDPGHSV